jgi:hypothetical protein
VHVARSAIRLKPSCSGTDDHYVALPAEPSPLAAPDRLSVWPVEGGRYGLDATYHGATGFEQAETQRRHLQAANLPASVRQELGDRWTLRLGPLTHSAAWTAIEAFIGPPALPARGSRGVASTPREPFSAPPSG